MRLWSHREAAGQEPAEAADPYRRAHSIQAGARVFAFRTPARGRDRDLTARGGRRRRVACLLLKEAAKTYNIFGSINAGWGTLYRAFQKTIAAMACLGEFGKGFVTIREAQAHIAKDDEREDVGQHDG